MLTLRGSAGIGSAALELHIAAAPGLLINSVDRTGLVYDSRLAAPEAGLVRRGMIVYVVVDGQVDWHQTGTVHRAPLAFRLPAAEFEALAPGPRRTVRLGGDHFRAVEIWSEEAEPAPVGLLDGADALIAAGASYLAACRFGDGEPDRDEEGWGERIAPMLREAEAGPKALEALDPAQAAMSPVLRDTWAAFGELFRSVDLAATQSQLAEAAGRSSRQANRDFLAILRHFEAAGDGFRDVLLRWRLRAAVLFLSAADGDVATVARAVGYARPEAMANAFQRAGLPSPSRVRSALLAP